MNSSPNVLVQFFGKLLLLFPPRTEAFLKSASIQDLQQVSFRYIFSLQAMIEISHMIEDFVMANPRTADMHVSFQALSRFSYQYERYVNIVEAANGLWLYGALDVSPPNLRKTIIVDTAGTPLEKYWFVIAYGQGVHMTLLAEEINVERLPHEPRMYEGFYTFDPNLAYKVLSVLHIIFPEQVPVPLPPELLQKL